MPTYSFRCPKCSHKLDEFKKMSEADERIICPRCMYDDRGEVGMKRVPTAPLAVYPNGMKPGLTIADHKKKRKPRD